MLTLQFRHSQVSLVSVVPGCFPLRSSASGGGGGGSSDEMEPGDDDMRSGGHGRGRGDGTEKGGLSKHQRRRCKQCLLERERLRSHAWQPPGSLSAPSTPSTPSFSGGRRVQYGAARIQGLLGKLAPTLRRYHCPCPDVYISPYSCCSVHSSPSNRMCTSSSWCVVSPRCVQCAGPTRSSSDAAHEHRRGCRQQVHV